LMARFWQEVGITLPVSNFCANLLENKYKCSICNRHVDAVKR
jgi:hypothetical protein